MKQLTSVDLDLSMSSIQERFVAIKPDLDQWSTSIRNELEKDPKLLEIHPLLKTRIKTDASFMQKVEKLIKENESDEEITAENFTNFVQDLCGVRLIVAHKGHLELANDRIMKSKTWQVVGEPMFYVWHDEEIDELRALGREGTVKESGYCSRHYILVRAGEDPSLPSAIKCEVQIRTILEEALFENDHQIKYKNCHHRIITEMFKYLAQAFEVQDHLIKQAYSWAEELKSLDSEKV